MPRRAVRATVAALAGIVILGATSSCSWVSGLFGSDDPAKGTEVSVFDVAVGDCFVAPKKVEAQLADLTKVPCDVAHQQELYAVVQYDDGTGSDSGASGQAADYPGGAALETFAKGACAQEFTGYVGIAYQDSGLWMTYLLPSARSWQKNKDRSVLCFVTTTTGGSLTASVKGSKL